jgi:hypothetical protein
MGRERNRTTIRAMCILKSNSVPPRQTTLPFAKTRFLGRNRLGNQFPSLFDLGVKRLSDAKLGGFLPS